MAIKTLTYHAIKPGKTLAVVGGVHGNERCGPEAIYQCIAKMEEGAIILKQGTLQLMPVANPKAYEQNVRFVERNLNRYLYPKEFKQHYEDFLDPILCAFLDKTDVLLDLHSYSSPGEAFVFLGRPHADEVMYARALGVQDFVYGWVDAYGKSGKGHTKESQGTTEYTRLKNNALAVTLECGQHYNATAADVGYQAILRALVHLDMLDMQCDAALALNNVKQIDPAAQRCVQMQHVYYREGQASFVKDWQHFDFVAKDEVIAAHGNTPVLTAPEDGYIILPTAEVAEGDEWFYFGVASAFPA